MTVAPFPKDVAYVEWADQGSRLFQRCERRQFMAIVLDPFGRVIGSGYNGAPAGMAHCAEACPHRHDPLGLSSAQASNCIAVHAEANALLYSDFTARRGGTLIVNGKPCANCATLIANSGIVRVVCTMDGTGGGIPTLEAAGITVVVVG